MGLQDEMKRSGDTDWWRMKVWKWNIPSNFCRLPGICPGSTGSLPVDVYHYVRSHRCCSDGAEADERVKGLRR